jgi:hypothetical protein
MSFQPLRLVGPLAMLTGTLFVLAQIVLKLTFAPTDRVATITNPWFAGAQIGYFGAFCLLLLTAVGLYAIQADRAGWFGLVAFGAAVVGTMALAGDLWFDAFAGPWIVANDPDLANHPSGSLMAGAFTSYVLFATGWVLFGLASLRARVYPALGSIGLIVGGAAGFFALMAPYGIPLGLAVLALGAWLVAADERRYVPSAVAA